MKQRIYRALAGVIFISLAGLPARLTFAQPESDDEVRIILQERIDVAKRGVGIVIGLVDEKGPRVISYGKPAQNSTQPLNGDSVFEIGSVTKVFTATLLSDMVERGEVSLSDPISKFLPKSVKTPTRNGKEITLLDLSTQTSGLPRLPGNLSPKDPANPYADYSVEQLYSFLGGYELARDIGSKYEYSNVGVGLLGHVLAPRAEADYEALVRKRILDPLQMSSTGITLTPAMQARLVPGHDQRLQPARNWDLPTLAGAGALRSTVNDMLRFVSANLGLQKSSLLRAMQAAHQTRSETGVADLQIGLNWHILNKFDSRIIWHNGGTGGYHSFVGFDPRQRRGVVVLSNSVNDIDDIGRHLLVSQYPLAKVSPPKEYKEIKLEAAALDAFVGEYQFVPGVSLVITREGEQLFAQATGQSKYQIFAQSDKDFFYKVAEAEITFTKDEKGQVTGLLLRQNSRETKGQKIK